MFNYIIVVTIFVLSAMVLAVPSWGLQFRIVRNDQFVKMCKKGDTKGVIEAIRSGANVDAKDNDGVTALIRAAENGHTEIVKALIKAGADINAKTNAKNNNGVIALIRAAQNGHTEIVKALIQAGVDVNANLDGFTALMFAAVRGHTGIVNALIQAGADVNAKENHFGWTALMKAAQNGLTETVNALIDAGSNVKQRDNSGKMALDYARKNDKLKGTDAFKRLEELSR